MAGRHCHDLAGAVKVPEGYKKIVLVGNPNVGKSVFFNAFTGSYVEVSNFPGTTVDINYSRFGSAYLIDTPGVYGVSSFNDEERVARDIILKADQVVNIVDALHLERDLFLTQQIIDMGIPLVVVLNMMDEAENNGLQIDIKKLAGLLGVPVVGTVAVKGQGLQEVKDALPKARAGKMDPWLKEQLELLTEETRHQGDALMILEEDPDVTAYHGNAGIAGRREEIYLRRRRMVDHVIAQVVTQKDGAMSFSTRLGQQLLRPVVGIPALILFLIAMYYFIGVFIAQVVVGFTEEVLLAGYYGTFIENLVSRFISAETLLGNILIGEFGLLTMTVIYLFGLLLPLIVGFYLALSLMEDSGYLPRLAALVDRVLMGLGLNGRAVIPMILGFGCVTMATITTRLLGSRRERVIATVLLGITIPCSAQLGVIAALIAPLGISYFFGYILVILIVFVLLGTGLNRVLPGSSTDLLIDLPPLRLPLFKNVAKKTYMRTSHFMKEAAPLFGVGAVFISLLHYGGILESLQSALKPLTVSWLSLKPEVANALIMGFIRRDFGAAGLIGMELTAPQTLVSLVVITLFVPCLASVFIILKERGWLEGAYIWAGSLVTAFLVGGILARIII